MIGGKCNMPIQVAKHYLNATHQFFNIVFLELKKMNHFDFWIKCNKFSYLWRVEEVGFSWWIVQFENSIECELCKSL